MGRTITAGFIFAGLLVSSVALAIPRLAVHKEPLSSAVIDGATMAAARWTGWVEVADDRTIAWEIFFDGDASPATTAVTMRCETSEDGTVANDAGYDVHILEASGTSGTSTSNTHTWSNAVTADEKWTWSVANLPHQYINCVFTGTSGDANDVLTVKHKRISP